MSLDANPVALGDATKKSQYDVLYDGLREAYAGLNGTSFTKLLSGGDYTVLDDDYFARVLVTTGASDRTVTLPTAAANTGRIILIGKTDSGAGAVIVDGEGAETVVGFSTFVLWFQGNYIELFCDGSNWIRVGGYGDAGPVAYTPTLSNMGNAVASDFVYHKRGALLTVVGAITIGATVPTGEFRVTLPVGTVGDPTDQIGVVWAIDTGTAYYTGVVRQDIGNATLRFYSIGSGNSWRATAPFTWAAGDDINLSITLSVSQWENS